MKKQGNMKEKEKDKAKKEATMSKNTNHELRSNWRGVWIAEKDYGGMVVQIYRVCKECAREMLNRVRPRPAHPTYFVRISFKDADRLLRSLEGYGAWGGGPCDHCGKI